MGGKEQGFWFPRAFWLFIRAGLDPAHTDTDFTQPSAVFPYSNLQRTVSNHFGFYGQDEWHVRKSLSLTFALRTEHQSNPVCENRCFARFAGPFERISHNTRSAI